VEAAWTVRFGEANSVAPDISEAAQWPVRAATKRKNEMTETKLVRLVHRSRQEELRKVITALHLAAKDGRLGEQFEVLSVNAIS
jgi:hypothetical protein